MLVPGVAFSASRVFVTAGAAQTPDYISQGFGFMNDNSLAVDTDVPTGDTYVKGFRINSTGAVYGTVTPSVDDAWLEGIRVSSIGQIVYEDAATTDFSSRNPITANGRFAVFF